MSKIPFELNTVTLNAGAIQRISKVTRFLALFAATDAASVDISFNGAAFFAFPFGVQLQRMDEFQITDFYIRNRSASQNIITIASGFSEFHDQRVSLNSSGIVPVAIQGTPAVTASITGAGTGGARTSFTSTIDAVLLAANTARKGATIYNEGAGTLYVGLGTSTVSATDYTVAIAPNGYYEIPFGFTGQIRGIFGSAGTALVQELT